jgi:lysozyme
MMSPTMAYSDSGLAVTKYFESCRLTAYQDVVGVWTIGWGHTGPEVHEGLVWTQLQADLALIGDMMTAQQAVNRLVDITLTQNEFNALVDFVFNVGETNFKDSTLLTKLNESDIPGAASEFDRWDHAAGKVVQGLLNRREAETKEFLT